MSIDATSTKLVSKDFGAFPLSEETDFARSLTNCTRRLHKVRGPKIQDKQFEVLVGLSMV